MIIDKTIASIGRGALSLKKANLKALRFIQAKYQVLGVKNSFWVGKKEKNFKTFG